MNEIKDLVNGTGINPWLYSSCVFAVVITIGLLIRTAIWSRLAKWAEKSPATWDDELIDSISSPVTTLIVVLSFGIAGQSAPLIVRTHPLMIQGVHVAMIMTVVWLIERAASVIFGSTAIPESMGRSTRTLLLTIARAVLLAIGLLMVLDTIGVPITPILASLGVGSVAVALALQDTLSNFFGGLYILVDRPVRIGDFVKIDEVEGQVERIGWRSTWIRTLANDTYIVPNAKAASAQLKNYDLPNSMTALVVGCGVAYGSDLSKVEQIAVEVATEVGSRVQGADPTFQSALRFTSFAESSVNFNVVMQVSRFSDIGLVRHELIKALHVRFKLEGIEIPFPQTVIHWNPGPQI
jgi:small-conductance mechanosensitive channel